MQPARQQYICEYCWTGWNMSETGGDFRLMVHKTDSRSTYKMSFWGKSWNLVIPILGQKISIKQQSLYCARLNQTKQGKEVKREPDHSQLKNESRHSFSHSNQWLLFCKFLYSVINKRSEKMVWKKHMRTTPNPNHYCSEQKNLRLL